jgi:2-polyprenyl-3-methyl-5-hydroxy-6-metoxy-1,4-benzoquinol methylase
MSQNVVDDYGWQSASGPQSCGYIAPTVLTLLKSTGAKRVADLGSGNGALCAEIKLQGCAVVGIEYDPKGVELARRHYTGIPFHNFGVQDDPQALLNLEAPFDAVISTEVIEHLFSPHLLPQYAAAILKPGGHLIVSTPYHGYVKNVMLALFNKWDHHHTAMWHGGHIKFWSRATLTQLLEENGFEVVSFHGVGRAPLLWKSMILVARKR